ncbi:MAG: WD40 repeat domain-containing protein, partial [Pseudomonadota bacterium]
MTGKDRDMPALWKAIVLTAAVAAWATGAAAQQRITTCDREIEALCREIAGASAEAQEAFCNVADGARDPAEGDPLRTTIFPGHADAVAAIAVTPDGERALSASRDGALMLWDLETGEALRTFEGHQAGVLSVAIGPEGRFALSGDEDSVLILWDLESGEEAARLVGHDDAVTTVAFTPDGKLALSGSRDRSLFVWDLRVRRPMLRLEAHRDQVNGLAISADGA